VADGVSYTWQYDNDYRLTTQISTVGYATFSYDGMSNTLVKWHQGQSPQTMTYDLANRLTTSTQGSTVTQCFYTDVRLTQEASVAPAIVYYAYNQEQLALRTVAQGATETTYTYSRLTDLRLSAQVPSQSPTTFVWDGSDYLSSYQQGGTTVQYLTIDGEIVSEIRGGVVSDYVPDPLGSIRNVLNSSGAVTDSYDYWPYGELRQHTGSSQTPLQFVGS
jgi:hypothetical protein